MGKESSERIQTSILNRAEKVALIWLAQRQPRWVTSDFLTYLGVFGALLYAVGCYLANDNILYLWLASLGMVLNWYGDSLDGTLARVRQLQRPLYGFFIDHTLDAGTITIMCVGAGLSPMFRFDIALLVLAGYLVLSAYTYICAIVKNEFRLTYGSMGPTEFRLVIILMNIIGTYTAWSEYTYTVGAQVFGIFDLVGIGIAIFLFLAYIGQFLKDRSILAKQDPLKPYNPEKK